MNDQAIEQGLNSEAQFRLRDEANFEFANEIDIIAVQDKKLLS